MNNFQIPSGSHLHCEIQCDDLEALARPTRLLAKVTSRLPQSNSSMQQDDEYIVSIHCHGRVFHVLVGPLYMLDSPDAEDVYEKFLAEQTWISPAFQDNDAYSYEDIETFDKWMVESMMPVFLQHASDIPPSFDPERIQTGDVRPALSEYLFMETFYYKLFVFNDVPVPERVDDLYGMTPAPPGAKINAGLLNDLRDHHVPSFSPSAIEAVIKIKDPGAPLHHRIPDHVLVNLDKESGHKTPCFFKAFYSEGVMEAANELEAHLQVGKANLPKDARIARLLGIVQTEDGCVMGLLLSAIHIGDMHRTLEDVLDKDTPFALRDKWAEQIKESVAELHDAGVVWGASTNRDILIDKDGNVWITGFGCGHTKGWVSKKNEGTMAGDLQGVHNIIRHMFQCGRGSELGIQPLDTGSLFSLEE